MFLYFIVGLSWLPRITAAVCQLAYWEGHQVAASQRSEAVGQGISVTHFRLRFGGMESNEAFNFYKVSAV